MTAGDGSVVSSDDETPSVARVYDRLLGGAQNFGPDRTHAHQIATMYPKAAASAWAYRAFLREAVENAVARGVTQFLDLGSGIPTAGNVHEVAHRHAPAARVAYVDHEPVAVARTGELIAEIDHVTITAADLREPGAVLQASGVRDLLDMTRPIALIAAAVLHFVPDTDDPGRILGRYRDALAPGSLLILSHTSSDLPDDPELGEALRRVYETYAATSSPAQDRTRRAIRAIVESAGFTPGADGLVEIGRWGPPQYRGEALGGYALITESLV